MISLKEIHDEIKRIEQSSDTSWTSVQRLSWLYTVRNNIEGNRIAVTSKQDAQNSGFKPIKEGSDFLLLASQKNPDSVIIVVDELMDAVKTLHPRMYDAVMKKLYDL